MAESNPTRFLTVAEVAELCRVSRMTVYRWVHSGELPAVRFGKSFRVPEAAIATFMEQAAIHGVDGEDDARSAGAVG